MNFNPRSRERSDVTALGPVLIIIDFNPRSRERSDYAGWNAIEIFYISIHAPARGATGKTLCYLIYQIFQSTLPREERPISPRMFPNAFYFNPRSRERSDVVGDQKHGTNIISIHAPARGATVWT